MREVIELFFLPFFERAANIKLQKNIIIKKNKFPSRKSRKKPYALFLLKALGLAKKKKAEKFKQIKKRKDLKFSE